MRATLTLTMAALAALGGRTLAQSRGRLNPVIELLQHRQAVFGVYAPSNRRPGAPAAGVKRTPVQLARDARGYSRADFLFDGSMEHDFDGAFPAYVQFTRAMTGAAGNAAPAKRLQPPLIVKTHKIAPDAALAAARIARQLNQGAAGIVFVEAESAAEVEAGLAAMRFGSHGGTRPDDVGAAPAYWGMSEQAYREKADLWPLNPRGELINWTIVESKEGLAHVREIAAVKGIGVLFPGAGTLRGVFTTTDSTGRRAFDRAGWEAAILRVLAACQEFDVPCGYPANEEDIALRMKQGFSVFVMGWSEAGFKTVEIGRRAAGR